MQEKLEKRKRGNILLDKEAVTATCYSIATAHKHPNLASCQHFNVSTTAF